MCHPTFFSRGLQRLRARCSGEKGTSHPYILSSMFVLALACDFGSLKAQPPCLCRYCILCMLVSYEGHFTGRNCCCAQQTSAEAHQAGPSSPCRIQDRSRAVGEEEGMSVYFVQALALVQALRQARRAGLVATKILAVRLARLRRITMRSPSTQMPVPTAPLQGPMATTPTGMLRWAVQACLSLRCLSCYQPNILPVLLVILYQRVPPGVTR